MTPAAPDSATETAPSPDARRLEKLWDAYRAQEKELQAARADVERLTRELGGRDDATAAAEAKVAEKEAAIAGLESDKAELEAQVKDLEGLQEELKVLDAYKERVAELEAAHATERERLAKLYLVYEELEKEVEALRSKVADGSPAGDA